MIKHNVTLEEWELSIETNRNQHIELDDQHIEVDD